MLWIEQICQQCCEFSCKFVLNRWQRTSSTWKKTDRRQYRRTSGSVGTNSWLSPPLDRKLVTNNNCCYSKIPKISWPRQSCKYQHFLFELRMKYQCCYLRTLIHWFTYICNVCWLGSVVVGTSESWSEGYEFDSNWVAFVSPPSSITLRFHNYTPQVVCMHKKLT